MLEFLPKDITGRARGIEFLNAFMHWTASQKAFVTRLPAGKPTMLYLGEGRYRVTRLAATRPGARAAGSPAIWTETIPAQAGMQ